jgi:LemA protein
VYNTKVESVPTNLIANMFKFEKATYFEVNDQAVRQAPNVSFGEIAYRGDPQQQGQGQLPQYGSNESAQYGQPSDDLPNPQQYSQPQYQQPQYQQPQQPPGGYQPPQYQPPQQPPSGPGSYQPPQT